MNDFPASKAARGAIFINTGLKIGTNYAKYYANRALASANSKPDKSVLHRANANDIFRQFTRLRGTALKLAQSFSLDTGVLPDEFVQVMAQAQYRVPPMGQALVRNRIKAELGDYPEKLFSHFEPEALAAASIGQVHRALLKDGTPVVVKVQYPNVRRTIESDLSLARTLFGHLIGSRIDDYFAEIRDKLMEETDYLNEGEQLQAFGTEYRHPAIVLPQLFPKWTTERVLTMSFVEGKHLDGYLAAQPTVAQRHAYGQLLWDFFHAQIEAKAYTLHADLHPGNFLFRPDGQLGIIDFGCVKTFPPDFITLCMRLLHLHIEDNTEALKQLYREAQILSDESNGSLSEADAFIYFRRLGQILVQPYLSERFDFGGRAYQQALNAFFRDGSEVKPQVSQHFIFLNKLQMGLYSLLMKLGATIDMRYSRNIVQNMGSEANN